MNAAEPLRHSSLRHELRRVVIVLRLYGMKFSIFLALALAFLGAALYFDGGLAGFFGSLAATALWVGVAYWYTRQYVNVVTEYATLDLFPLETHINASRHIEVNVHGWDGLFLGPNNPTRDPLQSSRGRAWKKFFDDAGTLVLILPMLPVDAREDEEVAVSFKAIAKRNSKSEDEQEREIIETSKLAKLLEGSRGNVTVRYCRRLRWICTIKFDDRLLLVSLYAKRKTGDPFDDPAFLITLAGYQHTRNWIHKLHDREERILQ